MSNLPTLSAPAAQVNWRTRTFSLPFITSVYLSFPFFLFFFGWLTWYWALFSSAILIAMLGSTWLDDRLHVESRFPERSQRGPSSFLYVALAIVIFTILISGIGGWGFQESDWNKHNLVLKDLIERDWPVVYEYYGRPVGLVYYLAYYLPAALVGKLTNWSIANNALAIWSAVGLLLVLYWFRLLVNRHAWWIPFVFLLFSGLDLLGWTVAALVPIDYLPPASWPENVLTWHLWDSHISRWQYPSHLVSIFWVPNQALAAWSATGFFLFTTLVVKTRRYVISTWALLLFWSPFAAVGLAPLLLIDFLFADSSLVRRLRQYVTLPNLCGFSIIVLLAAFYLTKLAPIIPCLDVSFRSNFLFAEVDNWRDRLRWAAILPLSYLLEFAILAFFIFKTDVFGTARAKWLFWGILIWLCVMPLYVYGRYNDYVVHAAMPAIFYLSILVARMLYDARGRPKLWSAILALFIVGALNPLHQIAFHINETVQQGTIRRFRLSDRRPDLMSSYAVEFELARQYVSSLDTPFFRHLVQPEHAPAGSYWLFGSSIIMEEPILESQTAVPGDQIALIVPFKIAASLETNYNLATRLVGADGGLAWEEQGWPTGRPTDSWEPSRTTWFDQRTISLPAETPDGYYRLEVYFSETGTQEKMPIFALPACNPMGDSLLADYLVVGEPYGSIPESFAVIQFEDEITLEGVELPAHGPRDPGETLQVWLTWKTGGQPDADYVGFVHLLDEEGRLVAQNDRQPLDGFLPTTLWKAGLAVADQYQVTLPAELSPGRYALVAGMYDSETGQRLSLKGLPRDTVTLGTIDVADIR